jgi:RND family efflux transporter MFP subunit
MSDTDMMGVGGRQKLTTSEIEARQQSETVRGSASAVAERSKSPPKSAPDVRRRSMLPFALTAIAVAIAGALTVAMWDAYMRAPWTRDGTVRAYVVTIAPQVSGQIVELRVADNQFVHKGDLLMVIDPTNYRIAVSLTEAAAQQAQVNMKNGEREARRRQLLSDIAVSAEQRQNYETQALAATAQYQQALANLDQARVNLERTEIRSPVNGWVTNLLAQRGDYATAGQNLLSLTDADSFWVDAYFEENNIGQIKVGDPADVKLMGYHAIVRGHVGSVARAISVANAQPNGEGIATVNPIFTWVRLAQRIPVRIHIDEVPKGITLVAGMTATVQIDAPQPSPRN